MIGAGETVDKLFTYRFVDLSWICKIHVKIQGMVACVCISSSGEAKTGRYLGPYQPAGLPLLMNSRPIRDTAMKELDGISENDT